MSDTDASSAHVQPSAPDDPVRSRQLESETSSRIRLINEVFCSGKEIYRRLFLSQEDADRFATGLRVLTNVTTTDELAQAVAKKQSTRLSWIPSHRVLLQLQCAPLNGQTLDALTLDALTAVRSLFYSRENTGTQAAFEKLTEDERRTLSWKERLGRGTCAYLGQPHGPEDVRTKPIDTEFDLKFALETFRSPHDLEERLVIPSDESADKIQYAFGKLLHCRSEEERLRTIERWQLTDVSWIPPDAWFNVQQHFHFPGSATWMALRKMRTVCHPSAEYSDILPERLIAKAEDIVYKATRV